MATVTRYLLPRGVRRLPRPILGELKLWARVWLNLILPHRLGSTSAAAAAASPAG
jgi:hypothetical protein